MRVVGSGRGGDRGRARVRPRVRPRVRGRGKVRVRVRVKVRVRLCEHLYSCAMVRNTLYVQCFVTPSMCNAS